MSKRIYVGNLPWSVTKDKLEELFSSLGEIEEAIVISDKYTGRSRGFGFVTFKNDADADKAISDIHEKDVEGRKIVVREARPLRENQKTDKPSKDEGTVEAQPEEKSEKKKESIETESQETQSNKE